MTRMLQTLGSTKRRVGSEPARSLPFWEAELQAVRFPCIWPFCCKALFLGWLQYDCFASGGLLDFAKDEWDGMFILARCSGLAWVLLIVLYGILIPNTWQRCAAFVGNMAVCPLLVSTVGALLNPAPKPHLLVIVLLETAFVLIVASAIAVYGSHRIHVLGQQALEARKLGQYRLKRLLAAHLGAPVVPPDRLRADVPADLQAVLPRCLEKDLSARAESALPAGPCRVKPGAGWWPQRGPACCCPKQERGRGSCLPVLPWR
jgi:hypothetical protein